MSFHSKTDALNSLMIEECTAEWMMKMDKKHECVRHMAFMAVPDVTVSQISQVCDNMNQKFRIEDARNLCTGLSSVHAHFWPRFMQ